MSGGTEFLAFRTDAINTAARLETANKNPDTRICVAATVVSLHPDVMGRPVGNLVLRSWAEPFRSYEPWSSEVDADSTTAAYLDAFRKLEAGDRAAMPAFAALVGLHSSEQLAEFLLKRLLNGAQALSSIWTEARDLAVVPLTSAIGTPRQSGPLPRTPLRLQSQPAQSAAADPYTSPGPCHSAATQ